MISLLEHYDQRTPAKEQCAVVSMFVCVCVVCEVFFMGATYQWNTLLMYEMITM